MRLLWVQQWAVLPVIVENRDMVEENVQGVPQTVDTSARTRLDERDRPTQIRGFPILPHPSFLFLSLSTPLCLSSPSFHFISSNF